MKTFKQAVDELIAANIEDRTERMAVVQRLTDKYVGQTDGENLARLTDYILREELTDMNPYKIAHSEYPFMSERQLDLRRDRETGLKAVEETGIDGRSYREPKRRRRTSYEHWSVDSRAQIRNKERAAQYKRDTAPGDVIPYNLNDTGGELSPEFVTAAGVAKTWRERLSLVY